MTTTNIKLHNFVYILSHVLICMCVWWIRINIFIYMCKLYNTMYTIHQTSKVHNHSYVSLEHLEIYASTCQQWIPSTRLFHYATLYIMNACPPKNYKKPVIYLTQQNTGWAFPASLSLNRVKLFGICHLNLRNQRIWQKCHPQC